MKLRITQKKFEIIGEYEIIEEYEIYSMNRYPGEILKDLMNIVNASIEKWINPDIEQIVDDLFETRFIRRYDAKTSESSYYEFQIVVWEDSTITLITHKDKKEIYRHNFNSYGKNI